MLVSEYPTQAGRVQFFELESEVLRGNRYGDPTLRRHPTYLPPSFGKDPKRRYPVIFGLIGYTGTGMHYFGPGTFTEPMHERLDRLIEGGMPELIFVAVDCYNRLGGSQYVNGAAGRYEDHLVEELVPALQRELPTTIAEDGVGLVGKSSGGFGALHLGMRHPELFPAIASHSGDAGFDHCVWPAVAQTIRVLDAFKGDEDAKIAAFLQAFWSSKQPSYDEGHCLMTIACAAAYSPDPESVHGLRLPFNPYTGRKYNEIWERWLAFDPVNRVKESAAALRSLRLLFIDCGNRDQYGIQLGTRQLHEELTQNNISHEHEEFPGTHSGIQYRYDISVPKLLAALSERGGDR